MKKRQKTTGGINSNGHTDNVPKQRHRIPDYLIVWIPAVLSKHLDLSASRDVGIDVVI